MTTATLAGTVGSSNMVAGGRRGSIARKQVEAYLTKKKELAWLVKLIQACWAQNPEERPTMEEVLQALTEEGFRSSENNGSPSSDRSPRRMSEHVARMHDRRRSARDTQLLNDLNAELKSLLESAETGGVGVNGQTMVPTGAVKLM